MSTTYRSDSRIKTSRWTRKRIKMVADVRYGLGQPPEKNDEGLPIIRATNVSKGSIVEKDMMHVDPDDLPLGRDPYLKTGEIIVVRSGAYTGDSAIIPSRWNGAIAGYDMVVSPQKCHPEFLAYCLLSDSVLDAQILLLTSRAAQPHLNANELGNVIIQLPEDILGQKRIAAYLDASCAAIDQAVETKQKQLATLDTLRKSIITPAILAGVNPDRPFQQIDNPWLGQIPEGWKLVSLKRISETQSGVTLGKVYDEPVVERPYLRAANVQDGYLDLEKITTIELPQGLVERYELQAGDVLMTEGGDLDKLGRGFLWEGQIEGCLHQNHVFAIRTVRRLLLPEFLSYLTSSQFGRDYFEATGKRTTNLASTNSTKVGLLPVPLPSLVEQREIVQHINQQLKKTSEIQAVIASQITTLTNYRKSLIHECVTGKRRITEADLAKVGANV